MIILQFIILTILVCTVYVVIEGYSIKNNKNVFQYGYWTGVIAMILMRIILG